LILYIYIYTHIYTHVFYTEIPKIYGIYIAPREKEKIYTYTYKEAGRRRRSKRAQ